MYSCGPVKEVFGLRETPGSGGKEAKWQLRTRVAWYWIINYFSLHRATFGSRRRRQSGNGQFSHKTSSWLLRSQAHSLTHSISAHQPSISWQILCFPSVSLSVTQPSPCILSGHCIFFRNAHSSAHACYIHFSFVKKYIFLQKGSPNAISG